jgi:4,5-DOPA dioxygenase extradiol
MEAQKMPALFLGHGSPMNAIEDNPFSRSWQAIAAELPHPRAILCISAHWYTAGLRLNNAANPPMVYDMYGFPDELYRVAYPAPGAPELAAEAAALLGGASMDNSWGIDHGAWSVLRRLYPQADIPVLMLSVDRSADSAAHYRVGQALRPLRQQEVLILGSGNVVHNLSRVRWDLDGGLPWALDFDEYIRRAVTEGRHDDVIHYERAGESARLSVPTNDHYAPLLSVLGASEPDDAVTVRNAVCTLGSMSMTCYQFGT